LFPLCASGGSEIVLLTVICRDCDETEVVDEMEEVEIVVKVDEDSVFVDVIEDEG